MDENKIKFKKKLNPLKIGNNSNRYKKFEDEIDVHIDYEDKLNHCVNKSTGKFNNLLINHQVSSDNIKIKKKDCIIM